jgi:uncharacterized protein YebE (UPF0316 family)
MIQFTELSAIEMSLIVFTSQILFVYFRTINLRHIQEKQIFKAIMSNNAIAIVALISVTIGVSSLLNGEILPIIAHLIGGSIGVYLGMNK